jgi:NAD-dependent deacetylase
MTRTGRHDECDAREAARPLVDALRANKGLLLVLTGAGISAASGIPTFRGSEPDAIWTKDVTEMATLEYFEEDPAGSWRWYRSRFENLGDARPNPGHIALRSLERWHVERGGDFLVVTQNIDTLHERAGTERLVKVHGSADRCRCTREGCRNAVPGTLPLDSLDFSAFDRDGRAATLPRCPACGSLVRPHVLWFDELYTSHPDYQYARVAWAMDRMSIALCIGTSFAVGITAMLQRAAAVSSTPLFVVEPGEPRVGTAPNVTCIRARAEDLLPRVAAEVAAGR